MSEIKPYVHDCVQSIVENTLHGAVVDICRQLDQIPEDRYQCICQPAACHNVCDMDNHEVLVHKSSSTDAIAATKENKELEI